MRILKLFLYHVCALISVDEFKYLQPFRFLFNFQFVRQKIAVMSGKTQEKHLCTGMSRNSEKHEVPSSISLKLLKKLKEL